MGKLKMLPIGLLLLAIALGAAGCAKDGAENSKVYQGVCKAMADDAKSLTLMNSQPKLNPIKGPSATFDLCKARVGLLPEKGDVIRVAYLEQGKRLIAIKVMNVTKQDLRKK